MYHCCPTVCLSNNLHLNPHLQFLLSLNLKKQMKKKKKFQHQQQQRLHLQKWSPLPPPHLKRLWRRNSVVCHSNRPVRHVPIRIQHFDPNLFLDAFSLVFKFYFDVWYVNLCFPFLFALNLIVFVLNPTTCNKSPRFFTENCQLSFVTRFLPDYHHCSLSYW